MEMRGGTAAVADHWEGVQSGVEMRGETAAAANHWEGVRSGAELLQNETEQAGQQISEVEGCH